MVMDSLRSFHANLAVATVAGRQCWFRWFPADKDALPFPGWHAFGNPVWESDTPDFLGPGIFREPLEFRPTAYPSPDGLHFHGKLEWYQDGLPEEEMKQIVRTDECGRRIIDPRGGIEFGGSAKMLKTAGGLEAGGERTAGGGLDAGGLPVRLGGLLSGGSPAVPGGFEVAGQIVQAGGVDLGGEDRATGGVEVGGEAVAVGGVDLGGEDRATGGVEIGGERLSIGGEDVGGSSVQAGGVELRGTPSRPGGLDVGAERPLVGGLDLGGEVVLVGGADLGGEEVVPFSGARVTLDGDQTVSNITVTTLNWIDTHATFYDTDGYWDSGTPDVFTVPTDGYYRLTARVNWDQNATGNRNVMIFKVGASAEISENLIPATPDANTIHECSVQLQLTAGDQYRVKVDQSSGTTRTVKAVVGLTAFEIVRLG